MATTPKSRSGGTHVISQAEWAKLMQDTNFKMADQRLAEAYKEAMAALSDTGKQALRADQRAWVAKRERDAFAKFDKDTPEYARFLIEEAHARTVALQSKAPPQRNIVAPLPGLDLAAVQKAAELGNAEAQYILGQLYRLGQGVPQSHTAAARWYQRAAEQGCADAQLNLGTMYLEGIGVPKNGERAAQWLQRAAEQGDVLAQAKLGLMYALGLSVPANYARGVQWLQKAADQGDATSQYYLGTMYMSGRGVPQDETSRVLPLYVVVK